MSARIPVPVRGAHGSYALGLLAALVLLSFGHAAPAGAQARINDAGWWWRAQGTPTAGLLAPPTVAPGQLLVQGAPDGPVAIAAVRATLPAGSSGATLTLRVAEGQPPPGPGAVVLACPPRGKWFGTDAGAWESRPEADCEQSAPGMPSDDGTSWSFELGLLRQGDVLDVVLVPGSVEGVDVVGASFSVTFERPTPEDVSVSDTGGIDVPEPDLGNAAPPPGGTTDWTNPGGAPDLGLGPAPVDFDAPVPAPAPVPPPPTLEAPADDEELGAPPAARRPLPQEQPVSAARTSARGLGTVLLLLTMAAMAWGLLGGGRLPRAALLGGQAPTDGPAPGGLGRFTQPRTGSPPALR